MTAKFKYWPSSAWVVGVVLAACGGSSISPNQLSEEDHDLGQATPVDTGDTPGTEATALATTGRAQALAAGAVVGAVPATLPVPDGPPDAGEMGVFGRSFGWPIIPIHTVLLPDGRVLSYGNQLPNRPIPLLNYALWDPAAGTATSAMQLLASTTDTDIFCAGQTLLPAGDVLIVGGDRAVDGVRNYANNDVNRFSPATGALQREPLSMGFRRWYATVVMSAQGDAVVLGGRDDRDNLDGGPESTPSFSPTPELRSADGLWRSLPGATSDQALGSIGSHWYYPRAWQLPEGRIGVITVNGPLYALSTAGDGAIERMPAELPLGSARLPSVMVAPGRVLSVRNDGASWLVDWSTNAAPTVVRSGNLSGHRLYANATALADGSVWVNGGSSSGNSLAGAFYASELWQSQTGQWRPTAAAAKPRLYHSISMLMPDGSVLTGGGGAPGPVAQLNAEVFFPPYLYRKDGSGLAAERPVVREAPAALGWGQPFDVRMRGDGAVSAVNLVRFGAVTHAFGNDQRVVPLTFTQSGSKLRLHSPAAATLAPPGFYMLFVLDAAGVPSVARVVRLG